MQRLGEGNISKKAKRRQQQKQAKGETYETRIQTKRGNHPGILQAAHGRVNAQAAQVEGHH